MNFRQPGFASSTTWGARVSFQAREAKALTTRSPNVRPALRTKKRVQCTAGGRVHRGESPNPPIPESLFHAEPMKDIDRNSFHFDKLQGKVVYAVNVASEDDFTDANYKLMAKLHEQFHGAGFEILAFPSNWFCQKETKSNEEIKAFVQEKYGSGIILMDKFDYEENPVFALGMNKFPGEICWNFHGKFLFGKDGQPFDRFDLLTTDEHVIGRVQAALNAPG